MGFQISDSAPKITAYGRTFAADIVSNSLAYFVGVFENINGEWINLQSPWAPGSDMVQRVQAKGGIAAFLDWLINAIKEALASLFKVEPVPVPPTSEPTTDEEVVNAIKAALYSRKLDVVNGVVTIEPK